MLGLGHVDTSLMPAAFLIAAAHPADTRLLIAVVVFVAFVSMLPRPAPRPLAVAALCAIVAVWDFGATLIWGTGGPSKLRFAFAFSTVGGSALLACAVCGILAAAAGLRSFANANKRTGTVLAGIFAVAFAVWSSAVRYSPIVAAIGLLTGGAARRWAATMPVDDRPALLEPPLTSPLARAASLRALARVVLPFLSGALYYAWLRLGPKSSISIPRAEPPCPLWRSSCPSGSRHSPSGSPPALPAGALRRWRPRLSSRRSWRPRYALWHS